MRFDKLSFFLFLLCIGIYTAVSYSHDMCKLTRTNFVHSMRGMSKGAIAKNSLALLLRSLYNKDIWQNFVYGDEENIPKIIHQIWLGGPLPERYKQWQMTWIDKHPSWLYILWDDQALEKLPMLNKRAFQEARNYGVKSDIARYELLYQFGGVYVDTDMECLRALDAFHYCCDFYAGFEPSGWCILNTILAARPGDQIMNACITQMENSVISSSDFHTVVNNTGPEYLTRCFLSAMPLHNGRCVVFPAGYFFPISADERDLDESSQKKLVRPETYAIHHWEGSWL